MIAVLVPAHDEEQAIGACLHSLALAAACPRLHGEEVGVFVALDRCRDRTAAVCADFGVHCLPLAEGNVGIARATAARAAIAAGARWLACTDADSQVPADWLSAQLACESDAFCGIVGVADWSGWPTALRDAYLAGECRHDGHRHVHGANLGLSSELYLRCGGFLPLPAHEDVALVAAMERVHARIARRCRPVVTTSARRVARARGGFSDYLLQMERAVLQGASPLAGAGITLP
ncbi:glycosyltransferase [Xanthomonas massiliensis]|uniref:glycosyltransferase n=1 Tax=Xanthomonas massiliensis TaxID=1720302 RepID=UPI0008248929|nr:glycosyltransferase [Xanthomonas massiliensis]